MEGYLPYIAIIIAGYFCGSIPTSYIVGKLFFSLDLRDHGSGNVGATNALRVLGKKAGVFVLAADMGKGVAAVIIARLILRQAAIAPSELWAVIAGGCAIIGHIFTIFLRFKGGKGVATSAGVFMALSPLALCAALALFGITVWKTRYVSLGSILGALSICPLVRIEQGVWNTPAIYLGVAAGLFIIIKHKANISRLFEGTENKIGESKPQEGEAGNNEDEVP